MRVAIHQPQYLPWLGYLAKWAAADLFIVLDVVQYEKNGWQNRNRIKTRDGVRWLTVPVHASLGTPISAVTIDSSQAWPARHLRAIEQAYARAPGLARHGEELRRLYATPWTHLAPLATASAQWLARALGIATPLRLASELLGSSRSATASPGRDEGGGIGGPEARPPNPTARLVALCRAAGADTYLAGPHGAGYMDLAEFAAAGIAVLAQRYEHPVYAQIHGEFVPHLSALDLLLTAGDQAFAILQKGNGWIPLFDRP
ncbi:MAG TPA: WbqC family protein [Candidatus Acidoferrum sp.]|nr:WbqC family protein [Candidatus Acidoferrum sp.]